MKDSWLKEGREKIQEPRREKFVKTYDVFLSSSLASILIPSPFFPHPLFFLWLSFYPFSLSFFRVCPISYSFSSFSLSLSFLSFPQITISFLCFGPFLIFKTSPKNHTHKIHLEQFFSLNFPICAGTKFHLVRPFLSKLNHGKFQNVQFFLSCSCCDLCEKTLKNSLKLH